MYKNKNYKNLYQSIDVKNQFDVDAKYNQKQDKTVITVKENKKKEQRQNVAGMAIAQLTTSAGELGWGIK